MGGQRTSRWMAAVALVGAAVVLPAGPRVGASVGAPAGGGDPLEIVDLGVLPGGVGSEAAAINDRGWVVGTSDVAGYDTVSHAFLWRDGRMTDLGSLDGPGGSSTANDVNDRGEIVGGTSVSPTEFHAFVWRDGRMTDLGTLGGTFSLATGINDRGDVVGLGETASGDFHAFRWRDGRLVDLGPGSAEAVDDRGLVVGFAGGPAVWRRDVAHPLALVDGADGGQALDINQRGDIAGYVTFPSGSAINQAVVWRRGVPRVLSGLEGVLSQALALNDRGQVIGGWETVDGFGGFLWDDGELTQLPSLIGPIGGGANDINNRGVIVGRSPDPTDTFLNRAVLWR